MESELLGVEMLNKQNGVLICLVFLHCKHDLFLFHDSLSYPSLVTFFKEREIANRVLIVKQNRLKQQLRRQSCLGWCVAFVPHFTSGSETHHCCYTGLWCSDKGTGTGYRKRRCDLCGRNKEVINRDRFARRIQSVERPGNSFPAKGSPEWKAQHLLFSQ